MTKTNNMKQKRVVLKEELVALTNSTTDALVLNQMIYWSKRCRDKDAFFQEELNRLKDDPIQISPLSATMDRGWIYKTAQELNQELMGIKSRSVIGRSLTCLVKQNWLLRRRNPHHAYDRTWQYRVNIIRIQIDLLIIGFVLQDYELITDSLLSHDQIKQFKLQNELTIDQNDQTIPEITLDTHSKNKITKHQDDLEQIQSIQYLSLSVIKEAFEHFWQYYPKRQNKGQAFNYFKRLAYRKLDQLTKTSSQAIQKQRLDEWVEKLIDAVTWYELNLLANPILDTKGHLRLLSGDRWLKQEKVSI